MGKSKGRKFIAQGEGQHFHLLHRSQTDAAYASEDKPSDFVLVASNQARNSQLLAGDETDAAGMIEKSDDHVTSLGFKNDGYNYEKHLKVMGGGHFVGKDGQVSQSVALPDDVLASGEEMQRDLRAITINNDCMDLDMKDVLFGEENVFAEDGDYEEILDDFVETCMQEPEEPQFDFDAHIASLIAKSEKTTVSNVAPRGWGAGKPEMLDEEEEDLESWCSEDEAAEMMQHTQAAKNNRWEGSTTISMKGPVLTDEQFDKTLEEYGDHDIGGLSDEDEDMEGMVDFMEGDEGFDQVLDDFLQEEKDAILADGIYVTKGARRIEIDRNNYDGDKDANNVPIIVNIAGENEEQVGLQEDCKEQIKELNAQHKEFQKKFDKNGNSEEGINYCQEYLAQVELVEEWDCESVLSTYSTTDNHPSVIRSASSQKKKKFVKKAPVSSSSSAASDTPQPIILSGRYMLPSDYKHSTADTQQAKVKQQIKKKSVMPSMKSTVLQVPDSIPEGDCEEDEEVQEAVALEDTDHAKKQNFSRKNETSEEKKLRKSLVKAERKLKRESKKQLKNAFKDEDTRLNTITGNAQDIDNVSIFRYTH